jgi:hypothetical protein
VAVQFTSVEPGGKKLPDGGTLTTLGFESWSSTAGTENVTTWPGGPVSGSTTSIEPGHVSVGDIVSHPHLAMWLSPEPDALPKRPPT